MNIFFHSGINVDLSLTEIKSIFNKSQEDDIFIHSLKTWVIQAKLDLSRNDLACMQDRLWWTIKISIEVWIWDLKEIENLIVTKLETVKESQTWKLRFGLNSIWNSVPLKKLLLWAKKHVKSLRFLNNNFQNLTSVVTKKQILDKKWVELNIFETDGQFCLSETVSIQDIDSYSLRDYWKPKRDAKVWMLPPKLAQILINISWEQESIWDPFCGLWVIPIEAFLMWIKEITYSDIEKDMVDFTKENLEWIRTEYQKEDIDYKFNWFINNVIDYNDVSANSIATEWYLWTPLRNFADISHVDKVDKMLSGIWQEALENFANNKVKIIVLCLPSFAQKNNNTLFLINTLEKIKQSKYTLRVLWNNERWTLVYRKNNQFVYREILKLELLNDATHNPQ